MMGHERKPVSMDDRAFLAWLKTKPRDEAYRFTANRDCAIAQYLQHRHPGEGVSACVETARVWDAEGVVTHRYVIPKAIQRALSTVCRNRETTFGATADALEEELMAMA